jgi:hypothetical protein
MEFFPVAISVIAGYKISNLFSHPKSKVWQKMPRLRIKHYELFPNIRITLKGKVIHLHHWFNYSIILCISIFVTGGILDSWITRGLLMGSIVQGLRFPDRSIIQKRIL